MADLRNVAETLFFPMRFVAFWDTQADGAHLCRQEERGQECLHKLPSDDPQIRGLLSRRGTGYARHPGGELSASGSGDIPKVSAAGLRRPEGRIYWETPLFLRPVAPFR